MLATRCLNTQDIKLKKVSNRELRKSLRCNDFVN